MSTLEVSRNLTRENINNQNRSGFTALHLAVIKQDSELIEIFLKIGANTNLPNKIGETPLILAVLSNNNAIVNLLLKYHAVVDFENSLDILDYTAMVDNLEMWILFKKLTTKSYYTSELIDKALKYKSRKILNYLFKKISKYHGVPEEKIISYYINKM